MFLYDDIYFFDKMSIIFPQLTCSSCVCAGWGFENGFKYVMTII